MAADLWLAVPPDGVLPAPELVELVDKAASLLETTHGITGASVAGLLGLSSPWWLRRVGRAAALVRGKRRAARTAKIVNHARAEDEWGWGRILRRPLRWRFTSSGATRYSKGQVHVRRTADLELDELRGIEAYMEYCCCRRMKHIIERDNCLPTIDRFASRLMVMTRLDGLKGRAKCLPPAWLRLPNDLRDQVERIEDEQRERILQLELGDLEMGAPRYGRVQLLSLVRRTIRQVADGPDAGRAWRRSPVRLLRASSSKASAVLNDAKSLVENGKKVYLCCRDADEAGELKESLALSPYLRDAAISSPQVSLVPNRAVLLPDNGA